jgi:aminoglycoside 6-adenylyltransferase
MRTETEIFDLILGFARSDGRIRAVVLNGSRANPLAPRDILQDYRNSGLKAPGFEP